MRQASDGGDGGEPAARARVRDELVQEHGAVAVAGSIASAISVTIATAVATAISCRGLLSSDKLGNCGQWIAAAELGSLRVQ